MRENDSTNFLENPFSDYGGIVVGERFIGRSDDLRIINSRIIRPRESGNLAIIGEPRIGKSSLAYNALIGCKAELVEKKVIPIWINLATYNNATSFFCSLVMLCKEELETIGEIPESIKRTAERVLEHNLSWIETYTRIQRFFEKVRANGFKVLFIIDEFDHARVLFKDDISGFQGLRELSYRPEWRVTFLTTSRRSIREIELQSHAISTLDGIFYKHYLGMFTHADREDYFSKFNSIGIDLTEDIKNKINYYCGGHPYFSEVLGYEIVESYQEGLSDVDLAFHKINHTFMNEYDKIIQLLQDDGYLSKILQILFGPVFDVKQTDIDELLRYGLIEELKSGYYQAFSQHFQLYLKLVERTVDLWDLWKNTERALRFVVVEKMLDKYGEDWIIELEKKPNIKKFFDACREAQKKEERSFGNRASTNLLDFTYPEGLFQIIFNKGEWDVFGSIFKKDPAYWKPRVELLGKIRNPLAHNRDQVIYEHDRKIAAGYCEEILQLITSSTNK